MKRIGAALSINPDTRQAGVEAALEARRALDGARPSLALLFASPHHAERAEALLDAVHDAASPAALIGCIGEAVLGGRREIEDRPAVSVWLAALEHDVATFRAEFVLRDEGGEFSGWPEDGHTFLLVCDPFTFPADVLLGELDRQAQGATVVGGMASGGTEAGETRLFLGTSVLRSGAVGATLPDGLAVATLVSQGCRPVGQSFTVTRAEGNIVFELGGRPPVERIRQLYASLGPEERILMAGGLHIGRVIDEYRAEFAPGDFLVRAVIGADPESGAVAVGDVVRVGETVQFHVRDAASADEELRKMLATVTGRPPLGAVLFTCNGRGTRLFAEPDHDASLVSDELGDPPLAGFFCAGELGPVGGRNFLHGFTASMALFFDDGRRAAAGSAP